MKKCLIAQWSWGPRSWATNVSESRWNLGYWGGYGLTYFSRSWSRNITEIHKAPILERDLKELQE